MRFTRPIAMSGLPCVLRLVAVPGMVSIVEGRKEKGRDERRLSLHITSLTTASVSLTGIVFLGPGLILFVLSVPGANPFMLMP
jgi:hypothetical protein